MKINKQKQKYSHQNQGFFIKLLKNIKHFKSIQ